MQEADPSTFNVRELDKLLDQTKSQVFLKHDTAAFLGSVMCNLNFVWSRDVPTAGTDGLTYWWNPEYFMSLPPASRKTEIMHELWHVARLHMIRRGSRDPHMWNVACDISIDHSLEAEGFPFDGVPAVPRDPKYKDWAEEDIYDDLTKNNMKPPPGSRIDMIEPPQDKKPQIISNVVAAIQQAKLAGQAGSVPGAVKDLIEEFLKPVIPWQSVLHRWMSEKLEEDYTWARPNRRYDDMYLPSRQLDGGRLENLFFYLDVSGSITRHHIIRFGSELKFVKETYQPEKLTVVLFDTKIQKSIVWEEDDPFEMIEIIGRGGTSLEPVRRHMFEERPTAAIIFSDMDCSPMSQEGIGHIPVLWVTLPGHRAHTPTFGETVIIRE